MQKNLILLISIIVIVAVTLCLQYYIYQLVLIYAKGRGVENPRFWAIISAAANNGSGLFFYLFKRKGLENYLNNEELQKMKKIKNKIYCLMFLDILAFILFLLTIINM